MDHDSEIRSIVIFGTGDMGLLTALWLQEAGRKIAAFTVERSHLTANRFCGADVVAFEEISTVFPPASHDMLIAVGPDKRNRLRERLFLAAAAMGYDFTSYLHSSARPHDSVSIGRNCLVYENVILQPYARLGDNVMVRPLCYIGHHATVGGHSFVGPGAKLLGHCSLGERAFVAAGAVIGPEIRIGANSFIGANASVLKNLPEGSFVGPNSVAN